MTFYTENGIPAFNYAREKACSGLDRTLDELYGKAGVTEIMFRDRWSENMSADGIIADGWYSPPPKGMAVLSGDRVNFDSLRNPYNWSDDTEIDWNGVLYAYASPLDRRTGLIGDISVTLCFGQDQRAIGHVRRCHDATMEIFERLGEAETAGDLFRISQSVFERHRLRSTVISRTDDMPINLGHTFPCLSSPPEYGDLSGIRKAEISGARRFLNASAQWRFENGMQFTVEPQLVSVDDPDMPKITQHYVVKVCGDDFIVCNDIDGMLRKYRLI